jgi:hypothetical protein
MHFMLDYKYAFPYTFHVITFCSSTLQIKEGPPDNACECIAPGLHQCAKSDLPAQHPPLPDIASMRLNQSHTQFEFASPLLFPLQPIAFTVGVLAMN